MSNPNIFFFFFFFHYDMGIISGCYNIARHTLYEFYLQNLASSYLDGIICSNNWHTCNVVNFAYIVTYTVYMIFFVSFSSLTGEGILLLQAFIAYVTGNLYVEGL